MDYMKDNKEISAEEAVILWQASRLSLSKSYEKAPEILKVHAAGKGARAASDSASDRFGCAGDHHGDHLGREGHQGQAGTPH